MSDKQQHDNEKRFVLFPQKKTDNPKSPTWSGTIQIDGKEWKITGWDRESRFGKAFISGSVEEPREKIAAPPSQETSGSDKPW